MDPADLDERYWETEPHFGRTYQKYSLLQQITLTPVDEQEALSQKQQHALLRDLWIEWPQHRLYPAFVGRPQSILDCGFGTGSWAVDAAIYLPTSTVRGIDITPHLFSVEKPPNLQLQIADLNEKTAFPDESFDLVHSRFVSDGIGRFRWPGYLSDIYRILRTGGWLQIVEWEPTFRSNNGRDDLLTGLQEWTRLYNKAVGATGYPEGKKSVSVAQDCGSWLRTARFEKVQTAFKEAPTCAWSQDARLRRIGDNNLAIMRGLINSLAVYPVVLRGVANQEEFKRVIAMANEELARIDAEPFVRLYACWGRKEAPPDGA